MRVCWSVAFFLFLALTVQAQETAVLAPLPLLRELGAFVLSADKEIQVGLSLLNQEDLQRLSELQHRKNRCGGYEVLSKAAWENPNLLAEMKTNFLHQRASGSYRFHLSVRPEIVAALQELKEADLRSEVLWLSSFHDRDHRKKDPNAHVRAFAQKIEELMKTYSGRWSLEQIVHENTNQHSLHLRLVGDLRPREVVVLGAHLDSINWIDSEEVAPGADDNASGSSNIFDALRLMARRAPPERTVDFFWYAGEETGLLGSGEIATTYKNSGVDVVSVLQLDMTLFAGSGERVVGSIEDFTSSWLRNYFSALNEAYLGLKIEAGECGYGCSDHASWFRQGFPAFMPFEAAPENANQNIHSAHDSVESRANFPHALEFSKIAVIYAMDMANSTLREPK